MSTCPDVPQVIACDGQCLGGHRVGSDQEFAGLSSHNLMAKVGRASHRSLRIHIPFEQRMSCLIDFTPNVLTHVEIIVGVLNQ